MPYKDVTIYVHLGSNLVVQKVNFLRETLVTIFKVILAFENVQFDDKQKPGLCWRDATSRANRQSWSVREVKQTLVHLQDGLAYCEDVCEVRKIVQKQNPEIWLTFAAVLKVVADPVAIGDVEWRVAVEEGGDSVSQGPVVKVIELAVVVGAHGVAGVQERAAEELALDGASTAASLKAVGLKWEEKAVAFALKHFLHFIVKRSSFIAIVSSSNWDEMIYLQPHSAWT